jgi:hypothetical protein
LPDVVLHCQRAGSKDNVKDGNEAGLRRMVYADRRRRIKASANFSDVFYTFPTCPCSHNLPMLTQPVHAHTTCSVPPVRNYWENMKQMFLYFVLRLLFVTERFLRVLQLQDCGLLSFSVHVRPIVAKFLKEGHQAASSLRNLRLLLRI